MDDKTIHNDEMELLFSQVPTAVTIARQMNEYHQERTSSSDTNTILLLLIDTVVRRFQLVRLEFDATKLTIQDLLERIPSLPATDDSFRTKDFDCICDIEGREYEWDTHISDYVEGNTILIAVCEDGVGGREDISKLAKSILCRSHIKKEVRINVSVQCI